MGVYPEGPSDWDSVAIEKFRESNSTLYEWRETAHLIPIEMNRPTGRAIPVPLTSPAKAGAQFRNANWPGAALGNDDQRDWAPAFAGEGKSGE